MASPSEALGSRELEELLAAVSRGDPLDREATLRLWTTHDLTAVGVVANAARERVSGARAYYRGIAVASPVQWQPLLESIDEGGIEIHLTETRGLSLDRLCSIASDARALRPNMRLRALTWEETELMAQREGRTPRDLFAALADAGLHHLAGGAVLEGADPTAERWLPWIEAAARAGLRADLVWIVPHEPHRVVSGLEALERLAAAHPIFDCVVPTLASSSATAVEIDPPTGYNRLRGIALARLGLAAIPHVRGAWSELGESLMQVAQWYGADDAGGASTAAEGARLAALLGEAGREPVDACGG